MSTLLNATLAAVLAVSGTACYRDAANAMSVPFTNAKATALADAAAQGNAYAIKTQVREGADPNASGEDGRTLLQHAIFERSLLGVEALLDSGADPNRPGLGGSTAVHTATIADDPGYLQLLLAHRGDPNVRHAKSGETPLAQAVGPRTTAQFRMLLKAGADPNAADTLGYTPLHRAAMINAGEHVLALLEAGATPHVRNAQDASFQAYYFDIQPDILNAEGRAQREAVIAWLRAHDVALEKNVAP